MIAFDIFSMEDAFDQDYHEKMMYQKYQFPKSLLLYFS